MSSPAAKRSRMDQGTAERFAHGVMLALAGAGVASRDDVVERGEWCDDT